MKKCSNKKYCINVLTNEEGLLPFSEFSKDKSLPDGLKSQCKDCVKIYYNNNKDKKIEYSNKNKDKKTNYDKNYNIENGRSTGKGISTIEVIIKSLLRKKNIKFEEERVFNDCRNLEGNLLFFDFYLVDLNLIIECDGVHHFKPIFGYIKFKKQLLNDAMKDIFCKNNNIKLIRIPYTDFHKIDIILNNL